MEAVLAVVVGIAFGSALAAAVAFPLRRRRNRLEGRPERSRRIPLDRPEQRQRAAVVAAAFAVSATIAQAAGATAAASLFILGAIMLGAQAATAVLVARLRKDS